MIADPAFAYRLLLEQVTTIGCSVWWELKNRKERIKQEWDLALINVLTVSACNALVVWSLAPCRSYGNTFRFNLQNMLQKLPNNIFEKKENSLVLLKAAELCMVGLTAGAAQGALTNFAASKRRIGKKCSEDTTPPSHFFLSFLDKTVLSVTIPTLLCGVDRVMINHFDVIGVALFFSTALSSLCVCVCWWQELDFECSIRGDIKAGLARGGGRSTGPGAAESSSKWFISKKAIVSGLGLLGIKQGTGDSPNKKMRDELACQILSRKKS
ncbi:hypothetical protein AAG906_015490 [Vitis piasezkii]